MNSASFIPITAADIATYKPQATGLLDRVEWVPSKNFQPEGKTKNSSAERLFTGTPIGQNSSVMEAAHALLAKDEVLLPEGIHHTLLVLEKGLTIGMHLGALFARATNIEELRTRGDLSDGQKAELANKLTTTAAVAAIATAGYIVWELGGYRQDDVGAVVLAFDGLPELDLKSPITARKCLLYYYGAYLEKSGKVVTELDFVKFTLLYFKGVIAEIKLREGQLLYKEAFTDRQYRLEGTEFTVDGFKGQGDRSVVSVQFNKVSFDEIVGNQQAKHMALRFVSRILCYDMERKQNPMRELGGLPSVIMGEGVPGTGKSMMIAAIQTLLAEKCEWLGIPSLFHPLPDNIVSSFQGTSAERMNDWMRALKDTSRLVYAPIDDAENTLEERTRQGVSEGVRGIIGVFLRNTEGAYAVNNGNTLLHVCTNIPEQLDKAVLSRIVARFVIDGAQSEHDMLDQDYLWWKKYEAIMPGFIGMENPSDYVYLNDQRKVAKLTELGERYFDAKEPRVQEILMRVKKRYNPKQHRFFAVLYDAIQDIFPFFTSRDIRNIQTAVTGRILDFDFPESWYEKPENFFKKPYDDKKDMLLKLMKENMKGLSFAEVRLEEALRYIDGMVRITDKDRERKIEALIQDLEIRQEAENRYAARRSKS